MDKDTKSKGYEVQRTIAIGSTVLVAGDEDADGGRVSKGFVGILRGYTNAGFRGIEAQIDTADGKRFGVQAGLLELVDGPKPAGITDTAEDYRADEACAIIHTFGGDYEVHAEPGVFTALQRPAAASAAGRIIGYYTDLGPALFAVGRLADQDYRAELEDEYDGPNEPAILAPISVDAEGGGLYRVERG